MGGTKAIHVRAKNLDYRNALYVANCPFCGMPNIYKYHFRSLFEKNEALPDIHQKTTHKEYLLTCKHISKSATMDFPHDIVLFENDMDELYPIFVKVEMVAKEKRGKFGYNYVSICPFCKHSLRIFWDFEDVLSIDESLACEHFKRVYPNTSKEDELIVVYTDIKYVSEDNDKFREMILNKVKHDVLRVKAEMEID